MRRLAPMVYEVSDGEGCSVRIKVKATAFLAFGSVNGNSIDLRNGVKSVISPNMLSASTQTDRIHLHLIYQERATTTARYDVTIFDEDGNEIDSIDSTIDPEIELPYRDDIDLLVRVV